MMQKGRSMTHAHQPHQERWMPPLSVFLGQTLFLPTDIT